MKNSDNKIIIIIILLHNVDNVRVNLIRLFFFCIWKANWLLTWYSNTDMQLISQVIFNVQKFNLTSLLMHSWTIQNTMNGVVNKCQKTVQGTDVTAIWLLGFKLQHKTNLMGRGRGEWSTGEDPGGKCRKKSRINTCFCCSIKLYCPL